MITFRNLQERMNVSTNNTIAPVVAPPNININWKKHAEDDDIQDAMEYLNLNVPRKVANMAGLKFHKHKTRIEYYKAKDILRSSGLEGLGPESTGVKHKLAKISEQKELSPVLLLKYNNKLFVADGFHRVSTCFMLGENTEVACILVHVNDDK